MRHRGSAKQRVWLGPGRYLCGCERRVANAYTNPDSNGNTYSYGHSNCYANSYSYTDTNANFDAETHADTEVSANAKGSSYAAASPVEIFGGRNFLAIGDQLATP